MDLRNHGKSAKIKNLDLPHNMTNAAKDLANLVKSRGWAWPDVVVAHSMGGKVALDYTESCARGDYGKSAVLPKQLWVLDSVPGEIKTDFTGGEVEQILQVLQNLPSSFPSRKWVVEHFLGLGYSKATADWIGSNLKKEGDGYVWVFDLQATIDMFNSYWSTSYWPTVEHPPNGMEIAIVQGENSDRWTEDAIQRVRSLSKKEWGPDEGKVAFHVLPKAGHWVHVDNPKGLLDIMVPNFYSKGG